MGGPVCPAPSRPPCVGLPGGKVGYAGGEVQTGGRVTHPGGGWGGGDFPAGSGRLGHRR